MSAEPTIDDLCDKQCGAKGLHFLDCAVLDVPIVARQEIVRLRAKVLRLKTEAEDWKKKHDEVSDKYSHSLWDTHERR